MLVLKQAKMQIFGTPELVLYGEVIPDSTNVVERIHHILLLDRSGSMNSVIKKLIDNVKTVIDMLGHNDLISIIWVSGQGELKTVLKGMPKSEKAGISNILDSLTSTVGCTCFSEALHESKEIVTDLSMLCPNFSITLFTDGAPGVAKDIQKMFTIVTGMKNQIFALNTIGYGSYYNKELLESLSAVTYFGRHIHSDSIEEYPIIFIKNSEKISGAILEKLHIQSDADIEIFFLGDGVTKYSVKEMDLVYLKSGINKFLIRLGNAKSVKVNGKEYTVGSLDNVELTTDTINDLYRVMVYEYYYLGKDEGLAIALHDLHDKAVIDAIVNAFTRHERQATQNFISSSIVSPEFRNIHGIVGSDYLPAEDTLCVMDALRLLSDMEAMYIPFINYNRISQKTEDSFAVFKASDEPSYGYFSDIELPKEKLNISIWFCIKGAVPNNPREDKKVGEPAIISSQILRKHTIVKDGELNIPRFEIMIPKDKLGMLSLCDSFITLSDTHKVSEDGAERATVDFTKLPIINRMYMDKSNSITEVLSLAKKQSKLLASQKVYNFLIKEEKLS